MSMQILKRIFFSQRHCYRQWLLHEGASGYDCRIEPGMLVDINSSVQGNTEKILVQRATWLKQVSNEFARRKLVRYDDY